jgi:hypothetical protein
MLITNHLQADWARDDSRDHAARQARHEATAGAWFADLTRPQLARYNQRMADLAPYRGSPRWDRGHRMAQREWERGTAAARGIYNLAMQDLTATDEISEATSYAFDAVMAGQGQKIPVCSEVKKP